jgi:hypothetical protein
MIAMAAQTAQNSPSANACVFRGLLVVFIFCNVLGAFAAFAGELCEAGSLGLASVCFALVRSPANVDAPVIRVAGKGEEFSRLGLWNERCEIVGRPFFMESPLPQNVSRRSESVNAGRENNDFFHHFLSN